MNSNSAIAYLKLLRLPYQLQLGPIFAWGYLLAGGSLDSIQKVCSFLFVFLTFHIGAFGGLTALNSHYDRDTGPVGGLWQPPLPPRHLWIFAWIVQVGGFVLMCYYDWRLAAIYAAIVLLALGYSHPRPRWKGHPWKSVVVVACGQGVLDFAAGALTSPVLQNEAALATGMSGATFTVVAFYPLTQLYQLDDDTRRGDNTTAALLVQRWGRAGAIRGAAIILGIGALLNASALGLCGHFLEAIVLLLANFVVTAQVWGWSASADATHRADFDYVHRLMRCTAVVFGAYILARLMMGGLYA